LPRRGDQPRMPVAGVQRRVRGEHVPVAADPAAGTPGALALGRDDRQRVIVVRPVLVAELEQAGGGLGHSVPLGAVVREGRSSSVQHLGPPPPLSSSDMSTLTGSRPPPRSWAASPAAWTGSTT